MAERMTPGQLNARARELKSLSRHDEAEALYRQSLESTEAAYGPNHESLVFTLNDLAQLLVIQSRYDEAEALFLRSLAISDAFAPDHPNVAVALNNLAMLLADQSRFDEAEPLYRRGLAIFEVACGSDDPNVARTLHSLAKLLAAQHRMDEAEPLFRRSLAIKEAFYGPDHLEVAAALLHLAAVLQLQNRFDESIPLLRRCLEIKTAAYGPDHPEVAHIVKVLGGTLDSLGRNDEADALRPKASQASMLRRERGKKYLDLDGAHSVVHACSTVEGYLDRYASGGMIIGGLDREVDELTWRKDGRIETSESFLVDDQECCYCGMSVRIRPRFPNTSAQVKCSHCGKGQVLYVVQLAAGLEQALGITNTAGGGYTTIWLTVPLRHPEFSTLLLEHGVVTWRAPRRLGLKKTRAQNTWQDILWFEGAKAEPWWPRYREKFSGIEIRTVI